MLIRFGVWSAARSLPSSSIRWPGPTTCQSNRYPLARFYVLVQFKIIFCITWTFCLLIISGETILHIAIVNEDPAMVKFLLDNGADVNVRACGNFFCPDDQKDSRNDNLDHEWVDVCQQTNYEGWEHDLSVCLSVPITFYPSICLCLSIQGFTSLNNLKVLSPQIFNVKRFFFLSVKFFKGFSV